MENDNQDKIIENLRKCPNFVRCSQNFCPLDMDFELRTGKISDVCRWMREAKTSKVAGREFVSGGGVMPDAILKFVPSGNIKLLNNASKIRIRELYKIYK